MEISWSREGWDLLQEAFNLPWTFPLICCHLFSFIIFDVTFILPYLSIHCWWFIMTWPFINRISYFVNLRILEIHLFYNLQLFYWHFLEILWLFIFLVFYYYYFSLTSSSGTSINDSLIENILLIYALVFLGWPPPHASSQHALGIQEPVILGEPQIKG